MGYCLLQVQCGVDYQGVAGVEGWRLAVDGVEGERLVLDGVGEQQVAVADVEEQRVVVDGVAEQQVVVAVPDDALQLVRAVAPDDALQLVRAAAHPAVAAQQHAVLAQLDPGYVDRLYQGQCYIRKNINERNSELWQCFCYTS